LTMLVSFGFAIRVAPSLKDFIDELPDD